MEQEEEDRGKPKAFYQTIGDLRRAKAGILGQVDPLAFWSKRRLLLTSTGTPDSQDFGILEATVRFGRDCTRALREILASTLGSLIEEFGNLDYEVGHGLAA
jgi:hypothetical protein